MSNNKRTVFITANALLWAGAIILVSWYTKGQVAEDTSFMITMLLVAGWFTMNGFLTAEKGLIKQEVACIKRLFKGN